MATSKKDFKKEIENLGKKMIAVSTPEKAVEIEALVKNAKKVASVKFQKAIKDFDTMVAYKKARKAFYRQAFAEAYAGFQSSVC